MNIHFSKKRNVDIGSELLSVVIPSYNHEIYIHEAIQSVINQTYQNWELIIVDDGSKDNSLDVIHGFNDSRIRVIEQSNSGAHNAINRGLQYAKGKYLAVLNSDDVYEKNRFSLMIEKMQQNTNIEFMCSYIQVINSEGNNLGIKKGWKNMESWPVLHRELSFAATDDFKLNLLMGNFTSTTSNFLFTRSLYEKIGGMRNLRFAHDWDFALRAAEVTECKLIEKPLLRYRIHDTNTISSNRRWMLFEIAWVWAANLDRFYGKILFKDRGANTDIITLVESLNLQSNDKIFWIIINFINAQKKLGVEHPEEVLLEDDELRKRLLEYIVE